MSARNEQRTDGGSERRTADPVRLGIAKAVAELDLEHQPTWASDEMKAKGREPIGCVICFPSDGSWPCVTRMIADDLRTLIDGQVSGHLSDKGGSDGS